MRRLSTALLVLLLFVVPALSLVAQNKGRPRVRAQVPKTFPGADTVIFQDIFREGVIGTRPDLSKAIANTGAPTTTTTPVPGGNDAPAAGGTFAWSKLILPTSLEDEIKASKKIVDEEVSTPAKFAGNGYKIARKQFSVVAIMFAVIAEYDGDVRWKADAPAARDVFARTAGNCKVGTIQVYNEAKQRKVDIEDLLNGSGLKDRAGEPKATWNQVTDRAPLMQRLEVACQERMQPWLGNKSEFADRSEEILHEAQLTAVFAEVLMKEGMEDADDDEYKGYSDRMKKAALDIVDAVKSNNYDKASAAMGEINKSCTECHQSYRS